MTWGEAFRIAGPAYSELAFQATYALRQGNLPPTGPGGALAVRARRRVTQSKLLVGGMLSLIALGAAFALRSQVETFVAPTLDRGLYVMAILGAVLLLELALLWWTGLQMLPTYLSSGTVALLATLPIPGRTLQRVALILVVRLFDAPALACLVVTPLAVGLALRSWLAGLAMLPGVAVVVVLAMALSLRTGEFFVRHVQGAHASPRQTILRWGYLLLWAVPAFAMYGFIAAAPGFFGLLTSLRLEGWPPALLGVVATYPMSFGVLPALAGGAFGLPSTFAAVAVGASLLYTGGGLFAARWLVAAPLRLARAVPGATVSRSSDPFRLVPHPPSVAIIVKDLRIASRTPGFAFIILLPLLDALALGLLTFVASPPPAAAFNLAAAAVSTSALLATFFGPALFALEVMGYSYVRALPVPDRAMVLGKVTLVTLLYLASAAIVAAFTVARVFSPLTFLAFIGAELPAVLAAGFLEFGLLFRRARRRGLPVVNLYTGAWWATLVAIPGLLVAGVPLALFQNLRAAGNSAALPVLALAGLVELAAALPLALLGYGRGSR